MIRYIFNKVSREQLAKIAVNAINALADKRNFDTFSFTLDVDGDESDIEVVKDAQRWHKVSEEKPKKRQMVLAKFADRLAGHYPIDIIQWDVSYSRNHNGVVVTHWMPLPKSPKEDK